MKQVHIPGAAGEQIRNDLFGGFSIPRNWLVNSSGRHVLEQIGYAESTD